MGEDRNCVIVVAGITTIMKNGIVILIPIIIVDIALSVTLSGAHEGVQRSVVPIIGGT